MKQSPKTAGSVAQDCTTRHGNRHIGEGQGTNTKDIAALECSVLSEHTMQHHRIATLSILLSIAGCSVATSAQSSSPAAIEISSQIDAAPKSDQELCLEHLVGNWEATHLGRQILTTRSDGTATIEMCLTPMAAVAYGKRVTLDLKWKLEGSEMTQTIVGGAPANSVRKLIAKFGSTQCYHILEYQPDFLLVSNGKADSKSVRWTAVSKEDTP